MKLDFVPFSNIINTNCQATISAKNMSTHVLTVKKIEIKIDEIHSLKALLKTSSVISLFFPFL